MQVVPRESNSNRQIAPVSGESVGIRQSEIRQGVRLLTVCKDADGKIGVKVKAMNKGKLRDSVGLGKIFSLFS